MSAVINRDIQRFGRRMVRWRVQLLLLRGGACVLTAVILLTALDVALSLPAAGRWLGFLLILGLCAAVVVLAARLLRKHYSPEAMAAVLERTYPELDNRLINYVQFERKPEGHFLKAEYVRRGGPALAQLDVQRLRDGRAHRLGLIACSVAAILLIAPYFVLGRHWSRALWRSLNPVSALQPLTMTRILAVEPGTVDVPQGETCLLVCRVQGVRGHTVRVEVEPDDARRVTYDLGRLEAGGELAFSHRVSRVNSRFRYRFRAGDASPSDWYTVTPRPPPALTALQAQVAPPAYTRIGRRGFDLRGDTPPVIPAGSSVRLRAAASTSLQTLAVSVAGGDPVAMGFDAGEGAWLAALTVSAPGVLRFEGVDPYDQVLHESIAYDFRPDHAPVIEVLEPQGRVMLPPGEAPRIVFRVQDDYGLASVHIERVHGAGREERVDIIRHWEPDGQLLLEQRWSGEPEPQSPSTAYRIVAVDNTPGTPQVTRSAAVMFSVPPAERLAELRNRLEEAGMSGLQQVIALQERNLAYSMALGEAGQAGESGLWRDPIERQREIRRLTRELLQNPVRPLGGRTQAVSSLYANEMVLAIDALELITTVPPVQRDQRVNDGIAIQASILRQLKGAGSAADKAQIDRRKTGIAAMLAALIDGQSAILSQLGPDGSAASGGGLPQLAERQDALSEDVSAFEAACLADAAATRGNDAAFAGLLDELVRESRERRIRPDMLMAAERLEDERPGDARPLGARAHASLVHLQDLLERVELQRGQEERAVMVTALAQAQEKLKRIEALHSAMQEAIDAIRGQLDKDDEAFDIMAEEFVEIVKKNKESLVTIPVDLHVFTELNVGNELVEDLFSVFQEVEQVAGSDKQTAADVVDAAFAKNLEALELMREMEGRFDDVEMWLTEQPETDRVLTETLDREEMPEDGIALGALAAQLEDLIGDLMKQAEEAADAADDGASTHAVPDMEMGWDVLEGDIVSFAAKGKSSNQAPDHKEQDGRSNVGRQGMASGETAAGSGTIGEGDDDIEARRTEDPAQSGMVQLDGEADTVATGGGKLASGKADDFGMEGGAKRMDSPEAGSWEGMAALMANQAESVFAQASLQNVRVDSLQHAAHHLRQADDAIAKGDIGRLSEHRQMAVAALKRAQAELSAPPSAAMQVEAAPAIVESAVQSGADLAPPKFQAQVADYYKLLNETF